MCRNSGNFYSVKILTERKNLENIFFNLFFTLLKFRVGGSVKLKIKKTLALGVILVIFVLHLMHYILYTCSKLSKYLYVHGLYYI